MLIRTLLAIAVLAVGLTRPLRAQDSSATRKAILQIERDWGLAGARHDVSVFQRHVGDDFVGIYPTRRVTKADLIADAQRPGSRTVVSSDPVAEADVRVYGSTAVIRGLAVQRFRGADGVESVARTLYTEVFVWRDNRWQCVSGQYSQLTSAQ